MLSRNKMQLKFSYYDNMEGSHIQICNCLALQKLAAEQIFKLPIISLIYKVHLLTRLTVLQKAQIHSLQSLF